MCVLYHKPLMLFHSCLLLSAADFDELIFLLFDGLSKTIMVRPRWVGQWRTYIYYPSHCESEVFAYFTMICNRALHWAWSDHRSNWVHSDDPGIFRLCQSSNFLHARVNRVHSGNHGIFRPCQSGVSLHNSCINYGKSFSKTSFRLKIDGAIKKDRNKAEMKERKKTAGHPQKYAADVG